MKIRLTALAAILVVAACGGTTPQTTRSGAYRLYEATAQQNGGTVVLIDTRSRAAVQHLPLGTPSPDWHHYYTVSAGNLADIDPETGTTQTRITLPGDYQLPPATSTGIPGGLSPDGAWLVLQRFDTTSHLLVFDTTFGTQARRIELPGQFQFDAISNDGERVYLIQQIGNGDYHVRVYHMSTASLDPNFIIDKNEGGDAMSGLKLSGVASHDGQWLFSVYARPNAGAFIHALNLDGTFALCLELPGTGSASLAWSLGMSPDGTKLYAANPVLGVVTEIAAGTPEVGPTMHVGEPSHVWPAGAIVSADNRTLAIAGASGVVWLDTNTFMEKAHALDGWTVRSLALSADGRMLYAVDDRGEVAELSMPTRTVTTTFDPSIAHPIALMRVEALA